MSKTGIEIGSPSAVESAGTAKKVSTSRNKCILLRKDWGNVCLCPQTDKDGNLLRCVDLTMDRRCPKNRRVSPIIDAEVQNAYIKGRDLV